MWGWPTERETMVLPIAAQEAKQRLRASVQPPTSTVIVNSPSEQSDLLFNGRVEGEGFRLSQKIARPNNFIPFVIGAIEPTSQGCLVFVRYRLFSMTGVFLVFWLIVTFGFGAYLVRYEQLYHYAALSVGVGILNYAVALLNFQKQVRISRELLRKVLS